MGHPVFLRTSEMANEMTLVLLPYKSEGRALRLCLPNSTIHFWALRRCRSGLTAKSFSVHLRKFAAALLIRANFSQVDTTCARNWSHLGCPIFSHLEDVMLPDNACMKGSHFPSWDFEPLDECFLMEAVNTPSRATAASVIPVLFVLPKID